MQFKKYTKQRNGSIQGLRSFKDTLPKNIKKFISKRGQIYSETLNNWKHIVGENLFKVCYPKSYKNSNKFGVSTLTIMVRRFIQENERLPTYEDFLSGKGITFFHSTLSGDKDSKLTSEEILLGRNDIYCRNTIDLLNNLLASFLRYVTLVWGSYGGVMISGSIVNSLLLEEDYAEFRRVFEDSETMGNYMKKTPLAKVKIPDIGFTGGLHLARKYMK